LVDFGVIFGFFGFWQLRSKSPSPVVWTWQVLTRVEKVDFGVPDPKIDLFNPGQNLPSPDYRRRGFWPRLPKPEKPENDPKIDPKYPKIDLF